MSVPKAPAIVTDDAFRVPTGGSSHVLQTWSVARAVRNVLGFGRRLGRGKLRGLVRLQRGQRDHPLRQARRRQRREDHGGSWFKGKGGFALRFDGIKDYVDCGNGKSLCLSNSLTESFWVLLPEGNVGKPHDMYVISKSGTTS